MYTATNCAPGCATSVRSPRGRSGFNALIEASSQVYLERMRQWIDVALEEGLRFFITSLGDPRWVCERVHAAGGVVYHDVTEARWARKAVDGGADGLIAVNARAGGHAGSRTRARHCSRNCGPSACRMVAAGGIGTPEDFARHLRMGYVAAQLGTRFIATPECRASDAYKQAIVDARASDIVHTERLTGVPVAVIRNAFIERYGTRAGPFARWMLRGHRRKHWMRAIYTLRSLRGLRGSLGVGVRQRLLAGGNVRRRHRFDPARRGHRAPLLGRAGWGACPAGEVSPGA